MVYSQRGLSVEQQRVSYCGNPGKTGICYISEQLEQ